MSALAFIHSVRACGEISAPIPMTNGNAIPACTSVGNPRRQCVGINADHTSMTSEIPCM